MANFFLFSFYTKQGEIMQVNFTGIRNISSIEMQTSQNKYLIINAELTNDKYGNDLDEYKNFLRKNPNNFYNPINSKFVNITTLDSNDIYFNHKLLEINDSNLPICTYMAKLTQKIANKNPQEFIINKDYVTSDEFWDNTLNDKNVSNKIIKKCAQEQINILGAMTNPYEVKQNSTKINNQIQNIMAEYFDVTI